MHTEYILVAEDNPFIAEVLVDTLIDAGYSAAIAHDGFELLEMAQHRRPDLMLIDVFMPRMDGYEAIRQIRNDTRLAHVPVIILTASTDPRDIVSGFESGADDYMTKPFDSAELLVRIAAKIKQAHRFAMHNPLTGLPGNRLIEQEIRHWLQTKPPFTLLYIDLDNFKALNDTYGFARGDEVIKLLATLLQQFQEHSRFETLFVGHIGGDDFVCIVPSHDAETFCKQLLRLFTTRIQQFYDTIDIQRGYVAPQAAHQRTRAIPQQTLSIAGVVVQQPISYEQLSEAAATIKQQAKALPGNSYVLDDGTNQLVYHSIEQQVIVALINDQARTSHTLIHSLAYQHHWVVIDNLTPEQHVDVVFVVGDVADDVYHAIAHMHPRSVVLTLPARVDSPHIHLRFDVQATNTRLQEFLLFAVHLQHLEDR